VSLIESTIFMPLGRFIAYAVILSGATPTFAQSPAVGASSAATALVDVYPDFLDRIEGNDLIWKDGTRMPVDDGKGAKTFDAMLDDPDIKDMFSMTYPLGDKGLAPGLNFDPGRVRHLPLFKKMYGDCRGADFMSNAVKVTWLPSKYGKSIQFSKINGAATALQKASSELDKLPDRFLDFLRPSQGTYSCRPIAGTNRLSAHGLGIAIDIAAKGTHYWLWSKPDQDGRYPYRNEVPWEIVRIFEKYGFIWGGKWYHYDTMHFEYRPEIIAVAK
jgi:hypothetical protein